MTPSWPECFLESINSFAIITPSQICLLWTKAPCWGLIISRRTDFKRLANIFASTFVNTSHQANWSKIYQFHRIWNVRNKCNKGEINFFIQLASFVKFIEHDSKKSFCQKSSWSEGIHRAIEKIQFQWKVPNMPQVSPDFPKYSAERG